MIKVRNLNHRYGDTILFEDVSFELEEGESHVLMGKSGLGKSTILRFLAGLLSPSGGGTMLMNDTPIDLRSRRPPVGLVTQSPGIYPHMTVRQNIGFPIRARGEKNANVNKRVDEMLDLLGLNDLAERIAGTLSGGEMQRTALGKSLAIPPRILLLDEPLSNIDEDSHWPMLRLLKDVQMEFGLTTLMVTHNPSDALFFGNRISILESMQIYPWWKNVKPIAECETLPIMRALSVDPINSFHLLKSNNESSYRIEGFTSDISVVGELSETNVAATLLQHTKIHKTVPPPGLSLVLPVKNGAAPCFLGRSSHGQAVFGIPGTKILCVSDSPPDSAINDQNYFIELQGVGVFDAKSLQRLNVRICSK